MEQIESRASRLVEVVKKGVAAVAAGVLALSCAAGMSSQQAYATDFTSTYYDLPKANEVIDFTHTATDNGHKYDYHYLTIGCSYTGRVAPMMQTWYEILGLNYINAYGGPGSIFKATNQIPNAADGLNTQYTGGSVGSLTSRNSTLAIIGSSNNESPDEYIWNYCAWANGASSVTPDKRALDRGNSTSGALSVSVGGTEYADFPREIYAECDILGAVAVSGYTLPEDQTSTYGDKTYADWIAIENSRGANRPKGNATEYDPKIIANAFSVGSSAGGAATMVKGLHRLADVADGIVNASKDANGNHAIQTRYGGNEDNSTGKSLDKYEDLVQATQYYVMSKIEDGTVDKAVTALLVGYDPQTGNYAARKYNVNNAVRNANGDTASDPDVNYYGGRAANYLTSISTSITDLGLKPAQETYYDYEDNWLAWYTPEQIVSACDAVFVCDAPSGNSISDYLAVASNGNHYVVYAPAGVSADEEDRTEGLIEARDALQAAGAPTADFCFSYPANMFGNFYAQGVENGMHALLESSFTYPELFNLTDMYAYWAKNVWHVKDSALQSIVTSTTASMSMVGTEIGTVSSNYAANAESIFKQGNQFYIKNASEIDAYNNGNLKTYNIERLYADTGLTADDKDSNASAGLKKVFATAVGKQAIVGTKSYTVQIGDAPFKLDVATSGNGALTYASSDKNVVTVNTLGNVTIVGPGTATITVKADKTSSFAAAESEVTVTVNKKTQSIKADNKSVTFGRTVALNAAASGGGALTYASSDEAIATVSPAGVVTGKGGGKATITINAAENGDYAAAAAKRVTVTVNPAANTLKVAAKKATQVVKAGKSVTANNAWNVKKNVSGGAVTYKKMSGTSKIKVAKNGKITVNKKLKAGKYTIKVKATSAATANYLSASTKAISLKVKVK